MTPDDLSCCGADLREALQADFFRSLADPVRLQVVARLALAGEPMTVSDVRDCCGVHLSGVSRHLKTLREAGVVQATRSGREVRYSLSRGVLVERLRRLADALDATCCPDPERPEQPELPDETR